MLYKLLVVVFLSEILIANGQLYWNATDITDKGCTFPDSIMLPVQLMVVLNDFPLGLKLYSPFASKAFYRWVYQKAKNEPATTQEQIDSINMVIVYPGNIDVMANFPDQLGKVKIFDPSTSSYQVRCKSTKPFPTNSTCSVINASGGSAPHGFGCGDPMVTTIIWADLTSYLEWHCFEGDIPVFNAVSIRKNLTDKQLKAMTDKLVEMGFDEKNFGHLNYASSDDMLSTMLGI
jgi:hypothetical protein